MKYHLLGYIQNENVHIKSIVPLLDAVNDGSHQIIYLNNGSFENYFAKNVSIKQSVEIVRHNDIKAHIILLKKLKKADELIIHGFCIDYLTVLLILLFSPSLLKKISWISYGGDLYEWDKNLNSTLSNKLKRKVLYYFREHVGKFIGVFEPDTEYYARVFKNSKAKLFYAPYVGPDYGDRMFNMPYEYRDITSKIVKGEAVRIQIAHQGSSVLNHKRVLDNLKRFSNENIRIFLPLNYGDKTYCANIAAYAEELFGDKAEILRDFVSLDTYYCLLKDTDIVIFDTDRQIGLGNLYPLMLWRKKIYMQKDSVMYDFFRKKGMDIVDTAELADCSFADLCSDIDSKPEKKFVHEQLDKSAITDRWKEALK